MQIEHHPAVQTAWLKACPQGSSAELTGSPRAALPRWAGMGEASPVKCLTRPESLDIAYLTVYFRNTYTGSGRIADCTCFQHYWSWTLDLESWT